MKYCFLSRGSKKDVNAEMMLPGNCNCRLRLLKPKLQLADIVEDYVAMPLGRDRIVCYAGSTSCGDFILVDPVKVCKLCKGKTDTEMLGMRSYGAGRTRVQTTINMGTGNLSVLRVCIELSGSIATFVSEFLGWGRLCGGIVSGMGRSVWKDFIAKWGKRLHLEFSLFFLFSSC